MLVGIEARDLEIGRQGDLQQVDLFFRGTDRLRVRAAQRQQCGIETVPHARIGIGRFQRIGVQVRDPFDVRQRRHVHDRHAGHFRLGHRIQQLAHTGGAILRLLHGKPDEVVVGRIDVAGTGGGHLAGQLARVDLDRVFPALDRHAHAEALRVDQVRLHGQTHQLHLMAAEQQLGGQQRPVGRAHDQDVVSRRHREFPPCWGEEGNSSGPGPSFSPGNAIRRASPMQSGLPGRTRHAPICRRLWRSSYAHGCAVRARMQHPEHREFC